MSSTVPKDAAEALSHWETFKAGVIWIYENPQALPPSFDYEKSQELLGMYLKNKADIEFVSNRLRNNIMNEEEYQSYIKRVFSKKSQRMIRDMQRSYDILFPSGINYPAFERYLTILKRKPENPVFAKILYYYIYGELLDYEENSQLYNLMDIFMTMYGLEGVLGVLYSIGNRDSMMQFVIWSKIFSLVLDRLRPALPGDFFLYGLVKLGDNQPFNEDDSMTEPVQEIMRLVMEGVNQEIDANSTYNVLRAIQEQEKDVNVLIMFVNNIFESSILQNPEFNDILDPLVDDITRKVRPILRYPSDSQDNVDERENILLTSDHYHRPRFIEEEEIITFPDRFTRQEVLVRRKM